MPKQKSTWKLKLFIPPNGYQNNRRASWPTVARAVCYATKIPAVAACGQAQIHLTTRFLKEHKVNFATRGCGRLCLFVVPPLVGGYTRLDLTSSDHKGRDY